MLLLGLERTTANVTLEPEEQRSRGRGKEQAKGLMGRSAREYFCIRSLMQALEPLQWANTWCKP
jgi:hypothetical protein